MKLVKREKVYWLDITINKKRIRKSTGLTIESEAKKWAKQYIDDLKGKKSAKQVYETIKNNLVDKNISFDDAWEIFTNHPRKQQPGKERLRTIKGHWIDFVAFVSSSVDFCVVNCVNNVSQKLAIKYIYNLRENGKFAKVSYKRGETEIINENTSKKLSNNTTNEYLATLKMIFNILLQHRYVMENPFINIDALPKNAVGREAYSPEELKLMGDKSQGTYIYSLILTGTCTGLRLGDIANLKWKIVDLENSWLGDGSQDSKQLKTGNDINLPIVEPLAIHFESLPRTSEYVFPELHKKYTNTPDSVTNDFKSVLEQCEIVHNIKIAGRSRLTSIKDIHSLRHTFAYIAAVSNIPLPIVQGVLGHMTQDMTKHYMNHASKKDKAKYLNQLPNYLATKDVEILPPQSQTLDIDISATLELIENMNSENWQINRYKLLELLKK